MHRAVLALALIAGAAAQAQGGPDLMKTPACATARQQLEEVLAAGGPRDRLTAVRRLAALQCLGVTIPEDSPGRPNLKTERAAAPSTATPMNRVQPPAVAVEPIRLRSTPLLAAQSPAAAGPMAAPPAFPGPAVLTACDATGCWDSAGARHNLQGPVLLGPRGACTQQGGLLNCP